MPFGLCNAPATYQRMMQALLRGLEEFAVVYLDDVLVFSKNLEKHLRHLALVFERFRKANLKLKPNMCRIARSETLHLGHIISKYGVSADPGKTDAVRQVAEPKNVKELQSFHGLASYYRKFVAGFASLTHSTFEKAAKKTRSRLFGHQSVR